ncbi:MAG: hypothetical protein JOY90_19885 [Bradyrhizobium sp.]|nr:hypothetical protein [Bradyrhizobium sp.]
MALDPEFIRIGDASLREKIVSSADGHILGSVLRPFIGSSLRMSHVHGPFGFGWRAFSSAARTCARKA